MAWSTSDRSSRLPKNWPELSDKVCKEAGWKCEIQGPGCTQVATECDHKIPGDNHSRSNLQAACKKCHGRKSALEGNAAKARLRRLSTRPPQKHPGTQNRGAKSPW